MSNYNTITSLAESPLQEGLIYAGTDDGILQITEDGGDNWRKVELSSLPGAPELPFVNDVRADLHDANTVYLAMDNHKYGDFAPYLYVSSDRGKSWKSIASNIPDRTLIWRVVQDHVKPSLMFAATEFGIYVTLNSGEKWMKLKGGVPTISFRDITIQRRENDLVAASFGRSFFILDDISVFREAAEDNMVAEGQLFSTRKAWWYAPKSVVSSQGSAHYTADNPPFGAVFTYHIGKDYPTAKSKRKKAEKELSKDGKDIPFPGWEALDAEKQEEGTKIWLTIKDEAGNFVRRIKGPSGKGFHRVAWDLRYPSQNGIRLGRSYSGNSRFGGGMMATPGSYTVTLHKQEGGELIQLSGPQNFEVVPLREGALKGASNDEIIAFREEIEGLQGAVAAAGYMMEHSMNKVKAMEVALARSEGATAELYKQIHQVKSDLMAFEAEIGGSPAKDEIGERNNPSIRNRMYTAMRGYEYHVWSYTHASNEFGDCPAGIR